MASFRALRVWERSHALVLELYRLNGELPEGARAVLGDELCRAATEVASQIAAASRCTRPNHWAATLNRAEAALARTEYRLLLGLDVGHLQPELTSALLGEVDAIDRSLASLRERISESAVTAPHRAPGVVAHPME